MQITILSLTFMIRDKKFSLKFVIRDLKELLRSLLWEELDGMAFQTKQFPNSPW